MTKKVKERVAELPIANSVSVPSVRVPRAKIKRNGRKISLHEPRIMKKNSCIFIRDRVELGRDTAVISVRGGEEPPDE